MRRIRKCFVGIFVLVSTLLISGCAVPAIQEANPEISLKLNSKGSNASVWDIELTKDTKELIVAGEDKTIRVLDSRTGKEKRKIIGEIGKDFNGQIYAIALSPDNRYLAVGGAIKGASDYGNLRLYNYKTGKIIKNIQAVYDSIFDLTYTSDGNYLVLASRSGTVKILDVKNNYKTHAMILDHKWGVYSAKVFRKGNKDYVVTAGQDGKISIFNIHSKDKVLKSIKSIKTKYSLRFLATTTKNGGKIAVSARYVAPNRDFKYKTLIFDLNLNHLKTLEESGGLDFSKNGKYLVTGDMYAPYSVNVYNMNNYKKVTTFKKQKNTTYAVKFKNNTTVFTAGGTNNEIYSFNIHNKKIYMKSFGLGQSVYRVGVNNNKVSLGNILTSTTKPQTALQKTFDLNLFSLSNKVSKDMKGISTINQEYSLNKHRLNDGYSYPSLRIYKGNKVVSTIARNSSNGMAHNAYGWYKGYIISAGHGGVLKVYTKSGSEVATLVGHQSSIFSLALDGDKLVSGSADQTLKIWDLSEIGKSKTLSPRLSIFVTRDNEWVAWTEEGYFNASENGHKYIGFHLNRGYDKEAHWVGIDKLYDHFYRPDLVKLALKGEDISKYTNGLSYKDVLKNPPPSIKITKANNKQVKKSKIKHYKNSINLEFNINEVDNGGVGLIRIYQEGKLVQTIGNGKVNRKAANVIEDIQEKQLTQKAQKEQKQYLASLDSAITKSINGTVNADELVREVNSSNIKNKAGKFKITLPLKAGKNSIAIEAFNKTNTVASIREKITVDAKIKKRKPTVYAIVAGVNEFEKTGRLKNLKYSENDAKAIKDAIKNKIKEKVVVKYLVGKDLTKDNLYKAVKEIKAKARLEDKVIFYISTHGKAIRGNMYLVPQNNKRAKNWIKFEDLFKEIQSINALEQIFVVDACESGKAKDIVASIYDSKASVLAKQSGVHVLLATAKGTFAFEHPNPKVKHGVFTYNILKALNDRRTDRNRDRKISVIELSKVLKDPKYVTKQQYPVIRNVGADTKVRDF